MSHYEIGMQTSLQPSYAQDETPPNFQNNLNRLSILPNTYVTQTERSVRTRLLQIGQQITNCREMACSIEEGTTQKIQSKGIKLTLTAELLQSMIQARELASQNKKNHKE
jgi:hypothetical protein